MLAGFMALGAAAVGAMALIHHEQWLFAAALFIVANIGVNGSFVFYDALLPHVAHRDEMDQVSTAATPPAISAADFSSRFASRSSWRRRASAFPRARA
jgi:MFS-type transporter involved in bile tolerance (Atg22 family)